VLRVGVIDDNGGTAPPLGMADRFGRHNGLERLSPTPLQRVGRVSVYEYRVIDQDATQQRNR